MARTLLMGAVFVGLAALAQGSALNTISTQDLQVSLDASGSYRVKQSGWSLEGRLPGGMENPLTVTGADRLGPYQELSFKFADPAGPMAGRIRIYQGRPVLLFQQGALKALAAAPQPFPSFTRLPQNLSPFSYQQHEMAPPAFDLEPGANVYLLFDAQGRSLILSPASHFFTSAMQGDGRASLACGFNPQLTAVPEGFTQDSLLALGPGINATWELWGRAMTDLQGKQRPANDADPILKSFGYWTDAGSSYWYNYEAGKGYEGTLKEIASSYKDQGIPLGYMQLDSWWYHKTLVGPTGAVGGTRNDKLPEGDWNRYGGTMDYHAHPFVFPQGMKSFTDAIGLPVINHNRWIDPSSPYHQRYAISGLAAIDPGFWDEIAGYLQSQGSIGYEQDWLDKIFENSPQLASQVGLDDAFMGSMAEAFRRRGMSLQYCMGLPMHFLQGSKYGNLTSIRPSWDRFSPDRYRHFLYTSRLATALGIWPWCDVFMSAESNNLLLSVLSAGPVGTGDLLGKEDKANILRVARQDGVLVKPDASLLPTDRSYLAEARHEDRPLVATTYTDHGGLKTVYAVAYRGVSVKAESVTLERPELGLAGPAYAYDYFSGQGQVLKAGQALSLPLKDRDLAYAIVAPVGRNGLALLGDQGKFVGMGKQRMATLQATDKALTVDVLFAAGETELTLRGYAVSRPAAVIQGGQDILVSYDPASGLFVLNLKPTWSGKGDGSEIRHLVLTLTKAHA